MRLTFVLIIFTTFTSLAQVIKPLCDFNDDTTNHRNNIYYKDLNRSLSSISGSWVYQNVDTTFTINLMVKKDTLVSQQEVYYEDILTGNYILTVNNQDIIDTSNLNFINDGGDNEVLRIIAIFDDQDNIERYAGWIYDPNRPYVYWSLDIRHEDQLTVGNGLIEVLKIEMKYSEVYDYPPNIDQSWFLPYEFEMTR
jgi:hypothetical protein